MTEKFLLRKEYVKVQRSGVQESTYGGDQNLFVSQVGDSDKRIKQESGCGLIALLDICLYIFGDTDTHEEQYIRCFNKLYEFYGGIRHNSGISGISMAKCFNRIMKKKEMALKASWGLSGKKMHARVEEMLAKDIPVVLCIPRMVLKRDKKDKLNLYCAGDKIGKVACSTNAHYVTITAIVSASGEDYYRVSSWGNQYFICVKEYDSYMKNHFLGTILGNVLYIQEK